MNIQTLMTTQQSTYLPRTQGMGRDDKATSFASSALPTAILTGLQALHVPTGSAPLPTGTFPTAAGRVGTAANVTGGILGLLDLAMNWDAHPRPRARAQAWRSEHLSAPSAPPA